MNQSVDKGRQALFLCGFVITNLHAKEIDNSFAEKYGVTSRTEPPQVTRHQINQL